MISAGKTTSRGVFLDRDGTINQEVPYLSHIEQFALIDGADEAIRLLNRAGFKVIVCTNQAGVARGYFSEEKLQGIHTSMVEMLRTREAAIDAVYYCPHHPTEGVGTYRLECFCRKPRPGMLKRAARELNIDLDASFMVGDKLLDLEAGRRAGCRNVLVRTGYGRQSQQELPQRKFQPDHVASHLLEAARWILKCSS